MIGMSSSTSSSRFIGIAQMIVSDSPQDVLVAANLGSCLGVAIYDRQRKIGGMIHCLLPLSQSNPEKAKNEPCMYVDTGVVLLLNQLMARGCAKQQLMICVAGGSNINDESNVFEIGKKNYTVLRKVLWKNSLLIHGEHCGDHISRTISLRIATGDVALKSGGQEMSLSDPKTAGGTKR